MPGSIQPTGSQNSQNAAVENKSVGKFKDWEIIDNPNSCFKGFPEKVSDGFSFARSFGRAWRAVKEGIIAFFQKLFGAKSKTPTAPSEVEMRYIATEDKHAASVPGKQHDGVNFSGFVEPSNVQMQSTVSSKKSPPKVSTPSTASVKKDAASSPPKYQLVDVPGDGHCGVWAVLAGMGAIDLSECIRPQHSDYGGRPIATSKQKEIMVTLRKRAEQEALKAVHTNPSAAGCAARLGLRDKSPTLETVDFQYIAQAIGRPIVVSQYQGNVEVYRTICDPKEKEPTSLFRDEFNNQQLRQGNPIRLYFDGGHYQLMQPSETV
ncbi:MAG: hypothetical protein IJ793_00710 [Opitutales bacterium]|nr:hypothetical protein [Opitutales bacterium]